LSLAFVYFLFVAVNRALNSATPGQLRIAVVALLILCVALGVDAVRRHGR
jgi:hypothetical protein